MTSTDYKPVAQKDAKPSLTQLIDRMRPEIARALPRHLNPDRMARIATTLLKQNPNLGKCTPESFLGALMTASQLGLEPGPLGEAYLVPYGQQCTFIPGYRGLIKLAWQSEQLTDIWAEIVYANDEFEYDLGLQRDLKHRPAKGERGKPTHVYAVAKLVGGGIPFVVGDVTDDGGVVFDGVDIRARSRASKNGPWVTDWAAMAKKSAIKQLAKWLPLSSEFASATQLDGSVRTDLTTDLVDVKPDYIDSEVVEEEAGS